MARKIRIMKKKVFNVTLYSDEHCNWIEFEAPDKKIYILEVTRGEIEVFARQWGTVHMEIIDWSKEKNLVN